jgi:dTDP-4-dehydrorhamnose reductase
LIWERIAPDGLERADWSWADERLERLCRLGIRPIVGLLHHGSGPRSTSLVDPAFPEKLAGYAQAVAERYPWLDAYTPVNEPLTTARFSGLYGHWYPHGRDENTFTRALLNQIRATQLAMAAVRRVNPAALLVQTEDLGKTFSTPALDYQADFENTRRWLSLDLLCGRMTRKHSLYGYFDWAGVPEKDLIPVVENPCPPDVIGLNYYLTSERFLDEQLEKYPAFAHGGNGKHRYADVEAVRVCAEGIAGVGSLIQEVWDRYGLPIALTEVHLGSTFDEQVRWLVETWNEAVELHRAGVDIKAVTAWSFLGSYNWHCLVTRDDQYYEPGVFDKRSSRPRPTLLASAVHSLARGEAFDHPVLDRPGWWRRPERLLYPPAPRRDEFAFLNASRPDEQALGELRLSF